MIVEILGFKNKGFFNVNILFIHIYEVQRHIVVSSRVERDFCSCLVDRTVINRTESLETATVGGREKSEFDL